MGGERRRRRLRRTGRGPATESAPDSTTEARLPEDADLEPGPDTGEDSTVDLEPGPDPGEDSTVDLEPGPDPGEDSTADLEAQGPVASGAEPVGTAPPPAPTTALPVPAPPVPVPPLTDEQRSDRRGPRGRGPRPAASGAQHRPSPADLAELPGPFALTVGVHDPEPPADQHVQHGDDTNGERGLRGLVGGGSSQVNVAAAMRARDASRPGDEHLAAAEADLPIVRRGWVPRDELPRAGH
jgi:hypothetical protein